MRYLLIGFTCLLTGCGTVMNGTTQQVTFDTAQGGGKLALYDDALYHIKPIYTGPLPATIEIPRRKILKYDVEREGFQPRTVRMKPSMSGWEAFSDAVPLFSTVDTLTGGGRKFDDKIIIPLDPLPTSSN